ncbi:30S ribosomal protein S6 [Myxococcota bacterium]|nr:30S ribosomal protein S6 [Myxococcota bacterium]
MREYELNFIIQPEISEEGSKAILDRLEAILTESEAVRLLCDDLGKRKLAYEVRKFQKGHYYILSFLDEGQVIPKLERALRLEESVLRFLSVKVADHVTDIEGRVAEAKEKEVELKRRAAERAAREAEEVKARAESEAAAERAAAEGAASTEDGEASPATGFVDSGSDSEEDEASEEAFADDDVPGEEEDDR